MKTQLQVIFAFFLLIVGANAQAFTKEIGKGFCSIRHPVEAITSSRTTCESQHIVQQQSGGGDGDNTIWINTSLHDYLDRSSDRPWEKERPWFNLGDDNLEKAYMMGTYANGYHYFTYDHHGGGTPTLLTWDGMSHLTYVVSSVVNFITKEMSYIGYQIERDSNTQYIDAAIGIVIDFAEVVFGIIYGIVGAIVGTILNPWDTLTNIPGGFALIAETIVEGIANTLSDILSLVTLGAVEF